MSPMERIEALVTGMTEADNADGYFRRPLVAVSDAADPRYGQLKTIIGPHHDLPGDIVPGARAVISFFIPFSRAVVEANRRDPQVSEVWARTYVACNKLINRISQGLVTLLESEGHAAGTIRATHTFDPVTLKAAWSHKSAACIAGMGQFGRNHLIITRVGCSGRFGTVVTAADLTAESARRFDTVITDAEMAPECGPAEAPQRCLHYLGKGCDYCVRACPVDAYGTGVLDKKACQAQLKVTNERFPQLDTCDSCGKCAVGPCAFFAE